MLIENLKKSFLEEENQKRKKSTKFGHFRKKSGFGETKEKRRKSKNRENW